MLTVRFNIINEPETNIFWESAKSDNPIYGMTPRAMGWGDLFAERDAWESRYWIAKSMLEKNGCWEELEKLDRLEKLFSIPKIRGI